MTDTSGIEGENILLDFLIFSLVDYLGFIFLPFKPPG